jgi:hypothetical protein
MAIKNNKILSLHGEMRISSLHHVLHGFVFRASLISLSCRQVRTQITDKGTDVAGVINRCWPIGPALGKNLPYESEDLK